MTCIWNVFVVWYILGKNCERKLADLEEWSETAKEGCSYDYEGWRVYQESSDDSKRG